jgi:ribonuclease P protein component
MSISLNVPTINSNIIFQHSRNSKNKAISHSSIISLVDLSKIPQSTNKIYNVGFVVSKKIGNAVARNRTKRIYRELCGKYFLLFFQKQVALVVIARVGIKDKKFQEIEKDFLYCLKKIAKFHQLKT